MKHISLLSFLVALSVSAQAQEVVIDTNYYAPPPVVRRRVLMADADQNTSNAGRRADKRRELLKQLDEVQTWYVGAEGGWRTDGSILSNSLDQLVTTPTQTKVNWGVYLGYTYRNAWTLETGYMQSPTHLNIRIANGSNPLVFNYQNTGFGIPFRIKRRIGLGSRAANGTGFWLTGGAWLVPNGSGQMGEFSLIGYTYRGRNRSDTIRLTNTTTVSKSITGLAELGVEYAARLSPQLELGFYMRKYWGLGNALRSDLAYTVNKTSLQTATVVANGTGWGFGASLRYIYGRQYEMKKSAKSIN
ncbi:hypothetical protein [Spirosoma fluviale]|uniref:Outer membrane protein beta-barrel domain-containing protein n=1 Tax=Spirosoma fluviale TaxID=1597977 RepID=A0A286FJC8_9BACT|nr:hypothetical protein [Spirosoma fluviale]SOD82884.1 hypothetical protein SAMN06269250_2290 [Spirosoma fluviale]